MRITSRSEADRILALLQHKYKRKRVQILTRSYAVDRHIALSKGSAMQQASKCYHLAYVRVNHIFNHDIFIGNLHFGDSGRHARAVFLQEFIDILEDEGYRDVQWLSKSFDTHGIE